MFENSFRATRGKCIAFTGKTIGFSTGIRPCGPVLGICSGLAQLLWLFKTEDASHAKLHVSANVRISELKPTKNGLPGQKRCFWQTLLRFGGTAETARFGPKTQFCMRLVLNLEDVGTAVGNLTKYVELPHISGGTSRSDSKKNFFCVNAVQF